jgi:integrase
MTMYRIARKSRRDDAALTAAVRKAATTAKVNADKLAQHAGITPAEAAAVLSGERPPRAALTRAAQALSIDTGKFCEESSKFYVDFTDHIGVPRRIPATTDKHSSMEFARRLELIVNARRAGSSFTPELSQWIDLLPEDDAKRLLALDLVDSATLSAVTPISDHVVAYVEHLNREGRTHKHTHDNERCVRNILREGGVKSWSALSVSRVQTALDKIREKGDKPLSSYNRNRHIAAIKAFANFMVRADRAQFNPLQRMRKTRVDSMHRRALSREEVPWLLDAARNGDILNNKRWSGTGEDRYLVYLVELHTGLRASALGGLCVKDFRLDDRIPCIRVPKTLEKNRTENNIPLPPNVVSELKRAFALKAPHTPALNCPRCGDTAWMVRQDMAVAKAAYVKAGSTPQERAKRVDDSFLAIKVEGRLPFDFHSLRVTAGTLLQEAGVPIGFVQRILNHKSLAMTLDNYNQPGLDTLHKLVTAAPSLATGTGPA